MLDSSDSKYVFTAPLLLGREDSVILNGVILDSLCSSKQNKVTTLIKEVSWEKLDKRDDENVISRGWPWGIISQDSFRKL